jgi:dienelactone hydrolase
LSESQSVRALYLNCEDEAVFAFFDPACAGRRRSARRGWQGRVGGARDGRDGRVKTAVVICPPFGWDLMCPYRARREWAQHLAARGHANMRIDLPATGDSAGMPTDPARVDAWTRAVCVAARWLRDASGADRIAALGIGLGGMVAYLATAAGAPIDDLALWGVPARGRTLVREMRALARLSSSRVARPGATDACAPPEGALLAGGYLLSAQTVDALERVELGALALPDAGARHVLLLGRGGARVDDALRTSLERHGASVTVAGAPGLARLGETFACVGRWLAEGPDAARPRDGAQRSAHRPHAPAPHDVHPARAHLQLTCDDAQVRESPVWIERRHGRLFGILAEPVEARRELCAVLLNPGPQRHIGPNRMWVEIARRWAARGVPSLRVDLSCIGDSDGDARSLAAPGALYGQEYLDETVATLRWLRERGMPDRFLLVGLCSGAYWAMHAALRDDAIASIVMLNPRTLALDRHPVRALRRRLLRRLARVVALRRALAGDAARLAYVEPAEESPATPGEPPAPARAGRQAATSRRTPARSADRLAGMFGALDERGQRALLMLTGREPLHEQLAASGALGGSRSSPSLQVVTFDTPAQTHTLAPLWLQREIHALVDGVLDEELERLAPRACDDPVGRPPVHAAERSA